MIPAGIAARPLQRGEGGGGDDRRARAVSGWASESGRCASRGGVGRSGSNAGAREWAAALGQRGSGLSGRRGCGVEWATGCGPRREVAWAAAREQAR